jgi:hypothetical protein
MNEELNEDVIKQTLLDEKLNQKFYNLVQEIISFTLYREDEDENGMETELMEPEAQAPDVDDIKTDSYDQILLTEPLLTREGEQVRARIIGRKRDNDGNLIGMYDHNPSLNNHIYVAEFPDRHIMEFSSNMISEAIYNSIDDDMGWKIYYFWILLIIERILKRKLYNKLNRLFQMNKAHPRFTTKGWKYA